MSIIRFQHLLRCGACALGFAALAALTGCASIVNGTTQIVSVDTALGGQAVAGAKCTLVNSKGTFYVTTPGTVPVHRDYGDLAITCEKDAMPTGIATVKSSVKGMAAGNILFGGVIGAAVDASSGAAYDYPDALHILMGQTVALGGSTGERAKAVSGSPAAATHLARMPSGQHPHNTLADAAVAINAPVALTQAPELPPVPAESWDARLSCGQRQSVNDGKPYNVRFAMEVRGRSVNLKHQNDKGVELMSGEIYNGVLALTGNGYIPDEPKRHWDYSLRGDLPAGATTYLAKGAMLSNGKIVRECQLSAVRAPAPKTVATAPAAAPAGM